MPITGAAQPRARDFFLAGGRTRLRLTAETRSSLREEENYFSRLMRATRKASGQK